MDMREFPVFKFLTCEIIGVHLNNVLYVSY